MWAKIVLNLLSNALKFTFDGRDHGARCAGADGAAELTVEPTPASASPRSTRPRLFERFHRVPAPARARHEGSGHRPGAGRRAGRSCTAARSRRQRAAARAARSPSRSRSAPPTCRPSRSSATPRRGRPSPRTAPAAPRGFLAEAMRWLELDGDAARTRRRRRAAGASTAAATGDRARRVLVVDDNADMRDYVAGAAGRATTTCQTAADGARRARAGARDAAGPGADRRDDAAASTASGCWPRCRRTRSRGRPGGHALGARRRGGARSRASRPAPTTTWSSRSRRASSWRGCSANLELDRARRIREQLERSHALLDQAQRLARVGSWEIDLATGRDHGSEEFLRQVGAERRGAARAAGYERRSTERSIRTTGQRVAGRARRPAPEGVRSTSRRGIVAARRRAVRTCRAIGELERDEHGQPRALRGTSGHHRAARGRGGAGRRGRRGARPPRASTRSPTSCSAACCPQPTFDARAPRGRDLLPGRRRGHPGRRRLVRRHRARRAAAPRW